MSERNFKVWIYGSPANPILLVSSTKDGKTNYFSTRHDVNDKWFQERDQRSFTEVRGKMQATVCSFDATDEVSEKLTKIAEGLETKHLALKKEIVT